MEYIPRTCTEYDDRGYPLHSLPIDSKRYRHYSAYVLLGDPGMGKTESFKYEAKLTGCKYETARNLIAFEDKPEWHNNTLFIDGLDEVRAGSGDARSSFDAIRAKLEKLGRPNFRLSCREADWVVPSDRKLLEEIYPNGIHVLHLDSLTKEDIKKTLTKNYSEEVQNPSEFIAKAELQGIFDLAKNPKILDILVSALKGGTNWPKTKLETFDLACRQLLHEHNIEHTEAIIKHHYNIETQLEAAGFIYALLLIARKQGLSRTQSTSDDDYPYLGDINHANLDLLNAVSKSKLFSTSGNKVNQLHRIVAEYLSAYYINTRIVEHGLPIERILTLITGKDGVVVTELRGLFAWLAALCHQERSILVKRDPLGVVLYGDVKLFSTQDKIKILNSIKQEAERYPFFKFSENWSSRPFGALGTEDMVPTFQKILSSPEKGDAQERLISCILDAMEHGNRLLSLSDYLIKIIENTEHWPRNRVQALDILLRFRKYKNNLQNLKEIAYSINNNTISDSNDELLGILLRGLYPGDMEPKEIFNYLHRRKQPNFIGRYHMFWAHDLPSETFSSDDSIYKLLDELVTCSKSFSEDLLDETIYRTMVSSLLARGIEAHGERVTTHKLAEWLEIGSKDGLVSFSREKDAQRIRTWFENHPNIQKALYEFYAEKCADSSRFNACMYRAKGILNYAKEPANYDKWCIEKAKTALKRNEAEAKYFLFEAIRSYRNEEGINQQSIDILRESIKGNSKLEIWLNEFLYPPIDPEEEQFQKEQKKREDKDRKEKQEWIKYFREQEYQVLKGTAQIGLMHQLGGMYLGRFIDAKGETPIERLENFFKGDENSVATVITGLKNCLQRGDLPDVSDIIKLSTNEHQAYVISDACRAGLDALYQDNRKKILGLRDDQLKKGVAFHLVDGLGDDNEWYTEIALSRSYIVAEVLIEYGAAALRSGKQHINGIYALAFDENFLDVASHAAIPILKSFPPRCASRQLEYLDYLLKAALRYADHQQLKKLINKKSKLQSMSVSQRVHWLGAGFIISPSDYQDEIIKYISGKEQRIQSLAGFLSYRSDQWSPGNNLPEWAIALLIRVLAINHPPHKHEGTGFSSEEIGVPGYLSKLINQLAANHTDQATKELENLLETDTISEWHHKLRGALYNQLTIKREYDFSHANIKQVAEVFHNSAPANAADLAALTLDHIKSLAEQIHNSSTNDYRQYWKGIENDHPVRKAENDCRDAFLSDLQKRLAPLEISAQPEGHYVNEKRADIRVSYDKRSVSFNVPIEVKCNDSPDLWHAIHNQLIPKYTRDPGAQGYGIYLVFWFGPKGTPPPPEGTRPKSKKDLEDKLIAQLSNHEAKLRISVFVVDCTGSKLP